MQHIIESSTVACFCFKKERVNDGGTPYHWSCWENVLSGGHHSCQVVPFFLFLLATTKGAERNVKTDTHPSALFGCYISLEDTACYKGKREELLPCNYSYQPESSSCREGRGCLLLGRGNQVHPSASWVLFSLPLACSWLVVSSAWSCWRTHVSRFSPCV